MKRLLFIPLVLFVLTVVSADPPYEGTIFIDADIITTTDPSTFVDAIYAGQGMRTMFDRRVNDWITVNAFLFNTTFDDGLSCEIQVNPEFGSSDSALIEAEIYGLEIGRLPTCLRNDVETVWIHLGTEPFGGGNNNILIHTGQAELSNNKINELRISLINEELEELKKAIKDNDILEVADALTDILYVAYGAGHAFGINLDECFNEVQESNMSKLGSDGKPIYNEYGKVMKGPNYFKPNLSKFL